MRLNKIQINATFFDYKPAHTKGTFFASLETSLLWHWFRGFTPDTPENGRTEKS
jgi:hypothetical protein